MASAIIHLAVAKILEKYLLIDNPRDYYLGAIAPDLSKQINETKYKSHFLTSLDNDIPSIKNFTSKYKNFKYNSFDLGYFIHLYTDKLWFENFIPNLVSGNYIKLLDGTIIKSTPEEIQNLIYNDYTNLNIQLIDEYNLDLSLFYEDFIPPKTTIDEIPINKLNILIDKMGIIITNSKEIKPYTFDCYLVLEFIDNATQELLKTLKAY